MLLHHSLPVGLLLLHLAQPECSDHSFDGRCSFLPIYFWILCCFFAGSACLAVVSSYSSLYAVVFEMFGFSALVFLDFWFDAGVLRLFEVEA